MCVISEEYNAKRAFEPSKTIDFRIGFSLICMFFHSFLIEDLFGGTRCPLMLTNAIFDAFWDPIWPRNAPLEPNFNWKMPQKDTTPTILEPTCSRFGTANAPKMYFHRYGVIFAWFWKDLGTCSVDFGVIFLHTDAIPIWVLWDFFHKAPHQINLETNNKQMRINIFRNIKKTSNPQPHKST